MEDSDNNFKEIRIGLNSKKNEVISLCKNILTDKNYKGLKLNTIDGSIGKLVDIVETLKILFPGLYLVNKSSTILYISIDNINTNNDPVNKIYPKMEDKLTTTKPTEIANRFQNKLSKEEREKLVAYLNQKEIKEKIEKERKEKIEKERKERIEREREERIERERKEKIEKEKKEKEKLNKELNDKYNIIKDDLPIPFKLDKTKYEKLGKSNNDKCLICLEVYKIGNQVLYLPCSHLFHSTCIMRWLLKDSKCPICKKDYRDLEDEDNNFDSNDEDLFNEQFFEDYDGSENSMPSFPPFYLFEGGNWSGVRGERGRGGYWRRGRGNWRGRRGNYRGRGTYRGRGSYRGQRGTFRGRGSYRGRGTYRGRGRGGYYYNSNYSFI